MIRSTNVLTENRLLYEVVAIYAGLGLTQVFRQPNRSPGKTIILVLFFYFPYHRARADGSSDTQFSSYIVIIVIYYLLLLFI